MNENMIKKLKKIFKILIYITITFFLFVTIATAYDYYEEMEKDKENDKVMISYLNYWNINSNHECKLKNIEYKNSNKDYIVTSSNRIKFKNGLLKLTIGKNFLEIKNKHNTIIARQVSMISKTSRLQRSFRDYMRYMGRFNLGTNKYGYENNRYVLSETSLYIEDDNEEDLKYYHCNKIK